MTQQRLPTALFIRQETRGNVLFFRQDIARSNLESALLIQGDRRSSCGRRYNHGIFATTAFETCQLALKTALVKCPENSRRLTVRHNMLGLDTADNTAWQFQIHPT